jgi:hypothetical protein
MAMRKKRKLRISQTLIKEPTAEMTKETRGDLIESQRSLMLGLSKKV